ncbi:trimethylamine methyltransferase family protein [Bacteroidota bacterium]
MSIVYPEIKVLSKEQIEEIHFKSLKVLSKTGIRVDSKRARQLFNEIIGGSSTDNRIRIPAEIVEKAIKSTPSSVDIYKRTGEKAFCLDSNNKSETFFGTGCTNLWYQDTETEKIHAFNRKYVEQSTLLGNHLNNYDVISTPGIVKTETNKSVDLYTSLELLANTTKPVVLLVADEKQFENCLKLFIHMHGDISSLPFIIPYFNPVTPLILNEDTVNKMYTTLEYDLPFIFSNFGMSGATTPITEAGTLVTLNAELLSGLVLTQIIKEGGKVILGSLPSVFDNKSMISAYTPQTILLNLACAEMMSYYNIPHCGTSGSGTGWEADILGSGTLWMNHLTSCIGKVGLAPFVGGNFASLVYSPETVVYSEEIIRQARLFSKGFELDDINVGLSEIDIAGRGGDFLTSDLTLNEFANKQSQHNKIWPAFTLDKWQSENSPKAKDILKEHTLNIIAELKAPDDHDELITKGEEFINKL